jgi:hypothetical protein
MGYEYSNPKLASDTWSLPNVEVFAAPIHRVSCDYCGRDNDEHYTSVCLECGREATLLPLEPDETDAKVRAEKTERIGFWHQPCFPGCLPDGDAYGPFETYEAALADAREQYGDDDTESEGD